MKTLRGRSTNVMTSLARQRLRQDLGARGDNRPPEAIDPALRDMVMRGLEAIETGDIATDDEVRATFSRYRL